MNGYLNTQESTLKISLTNIEEFKNLLSQAKKEADQLNETIRQLEVFELNIQFDF